MRKYQLLAVFQYAIVIALIIIGATTIYALNEESRALSRVQGEGEEEIGLAITNELTEPEKAGKQLWDENACGSCHNKNMVNDGTGPALGGVTSRWAEEPEGHLYDWVRNSQKLIASGESERAIAVWNENDRLVMSAYAHLTDEDVEALLAYIERE